MTVLRHENGNVGGINPIQYTFKEDVESFVINPDTLSGTIVLKHGCNWNYLYGSPESIQLEGKEEDLPAGMRYTYNFKMLIPKDRNQVEIILTQLNQRHLILNAIDKNGVSRYFGTLDSPMKKVGKLLKPATIESYQGWEVLFNGEFSSPAAYAPVTAGVPFDPPPVSEE
ncbi:MAG: hypothetical protein NT040_11085 [Bacteroidetes bacterium]|nr:hypothetical protein [Bacteroidota bacterium]